MISQVSIVSAVIILIVAAMYGAFRLPLFSASIQVTFGQTDTTQRNNGFFFLDKSIASGRITPTGEELSEEDAEPSRTQLRPESFARIELKRHPQDMSELGIELELTPEQVDMLSIDLDCAECTNALPSMLLYERFASEQEKQPLQNGLFAYGDSVSNATNAEELIQNAETGIAVSSGAKALIDRSAIRTTEMDTGDGSFSAEDAVFVPGQTLLVMAEDDIQIGFQKRNLNSNELPEELEVHLTDLATGKRTVALSIPDDGIINGDSKRTEQEIEQSLAIAEPGIYEIAFVAPQAETMSIRDLELNTGKVVFTEGAIRGARTVYTESRTQGSIMLESLGIGEEGGVNVQESSGSQFIEWPEELYGTTITLPVEEGAYAIELDTDTAVSNGVFALREEDFFQPYTADIRTERTSENEVLITRMELTPLEDNRIRLRSAFTKDELRQIQLPAVDVLERNAADQAKRLDVTLRATPTAQEGLTSSELFALQESHARILDACGVQVYHVDGIQPDASDAPDCATTNTGDDSEDKLTNDQIAELLTSAVPEQAYLRSASEQFTLTERLDIRASQDAARVVTTLEPFTRGSMQFIMYLPEAGEQQFTLEKTDLNRAIGSDAVRIEVRDADGVLVYGDHIDDDGDRAATNQMQTQERSFSFNADAGVYTMAIIEQGSGVKDDDFMLSRIVVPTNKFMSSSAIADQEHWFTQPVDIYLSIPQTTEVAFRAPVQQAPALAVPMVIENLQNGRTTRMTFSENDRRQRPTLTPGEYATRTIEPYTTILSADIGYTPDALFQTNPYRIGTDYVVSTGIKPMQVQYHSMTITQR